jgi:hypothetical protein
MKIFLFFTIICFFSFFNIAKSQTLTFVSKMNEQLIYYVDGEKIEGSSIQVTEGNHTIEVKYTKGVKREAKTPVIVNVPKKGLTYTINPPDLNILVKRTSKICNCCTQGELYVNDTFFCKTLELPFRNNENNISSIAKGTYNAQVKFSAKHNKDYITLDNARAKVYYKDINGEWKTKIVERSGILIHAGNQPGDIDGCILVGKNYSTFDECYIENSGETLKKLYEEYLDPDAQGKLNNLIKITVTIDPDYE